MYFDGVGYSNQHLLLIKEQSAGLLITDLKTIDDDLGLNSVIRYRLVDPGNMNQNAFYVDEVTGRVLTAKK